MLKIAIAGAGGIGAFHAKAIVELENAKLVGACARTPGKADAFCAEHGGTGYTELVALLETEKPDVLCVTTPSGAHLEPAQEAAQRGIHVICEKPLEVTAKRMAALIHACEVGGVQLGAVFQQRFAPLMRAVHDAVVAGRFGAAPLIQVSVPWWRDDEYYGRARWQGTRKLDGGGALMNQSIHAVDLVLWWARASQPDLDREQHPVAEVACMAGTYGHAPELLEVEDTAYVTLRLRDGRLAQILATTAMYPGSLRRFLVAGDQGTAEILEDQLLQWAFRETRPEDRDLRARFQGSTAHGGGAADPLALGHANHRANLAAFLDALESGDPIPLGAIEAKQAVDVVLAAYRSAEMGGKPVVCS